MWVVFLIGPPTDDLVSHCGPATKFYTIILYCGTCVRACMHACVRAHKFIN